MQDAQKQDKGHTLLPLREKPLSDDEKIEMQEIGIRYQDVIRLLTDVLEWRD